MLPPQSDRKSQVSLDNTKLNANEGPEIIVRNERSNLFTNNDRFVIE